MNTTTLFVSYTPSRGHSRTKRLVDFFARTALGKTDIQHLELTTDPPDFFMPDSLAAYEKRNYSGIPLNPREAASMEKMDRMCEQFINADVVVTAFPMYNLSVPALVKAYFDSVMLQHETWDVDEDGNYTGLMEEKTAVVLSTVGGDFSSGRWKPYEHCVSLAKGMFEFMGFGSIHDVTVQKLDSDPTKIPQLLEQAQDEIANLINRIYG